MSGYSGKPLHLKLGVKEHHKVKLVNVPRDYFLWLGAMEYALMDHSDEVEKFDFIHAFCSRQSEIKPLLASLKPLMKMTGMLWISWPKKSSSLHVDLDGNFVREAGLEAGLVDSKVCAVSEDWSGLKFTYRVAERKKHRE